MEHHPLLNQSLIPARAEGIPSVEKTGLLVIAAPSSGVDADAESSSGAGDCFPVGTSLPDPCLLPSAFLLRVFPDYHTILHYEHYSLERGDVFKGIVWYCDDISQHARLEHPNLIRLIQQLRGNGGPRFDRLHR